MKREKKALAARIMRNFFVLLIFLLALFIFGCKPDENGYNVYVATYKPQDVTQNTARCGGEVRLPQDLVADEIGVCWSTNRNPTIEGSHLSAVDWNKPLVCTIKNLEPFTVYHVRAYALCGLHYYYGDDVSFITEGDLGVHYVDLGLPSGIMWACCNIGADIPEDFGDYFAWGETVPKDVYSDDWSNYKHCVVENGLELFTKYCYDDHYSYNHFTDFKYVLQSEDDAAVENWGGNWRMPTSEDWCELMWNTTHLWTTQNGVDGMLFTANNGSGCSVFLPAAGAFGSDVFNVGHAYYWSSSLYISPPKYAWSFVFYNDHCEMYPDIRFYGHTVRAVRVQQK